MTVVEILALPVLRRTARRWDGYVAAVLETDPAAGPGGAEEALLDWLVAPWAPAGTTRSRLARVWEEYRTDLARAEGVENDGNWREVNDQLTVADRAGAACDEAWQQARDGEKAITGLAAGDGGLLVATAPSITDERTGNRWYTHPLTGQQHISVTTVTSETRSTPFFAPWGSAVTARFTAANLATLVQIEREQGTQAVIDFLCKESTRIRDLKRDVGSYVHAVVEKLVLWAASPGGEGAHLALPDLPDNLAGCLYDDEPVEKVADWMYSGFVNWMSDWDPQILASEMSVFHTGLGYAGTLDLISAIRGRVMRANGILGADPGRTWVSCDDVKSGKNFEATWTEQVPPYRRATEMVLPLGAVEPMLPTDGGAILHLRPEYPGGYRFMPISPVRDMRGWNRFRRDLEIVRGRLEDGVKPGIPAYPLREDGTVPPRLLRDLDHEGYGRVPGALAKTDADDLEVLAMLSAEECLALTGIGPKSIPIIRDLLADHGMALAGETIPEPATTAEAA